MDEIMTRFVDDLLGRVQGPMNLRLFLQPAMAILFAIRDGRKDAREGRVPYFWALFTEKGRRMDLLRNGWKSFGKIFLVAIVLDAVYQFITVRWFYPGEAIVVAFLLATVPYVLLRGPACRLSSAKDRLLHHG